MLALAATVLAARAAAQAHGCVATIGKVAVEPGGVNAIPSRVTAWLDARGADDGDVRAVVAERRRAGRRRHGDGHRGVVDARDRVRRRRWPRPGRGCSTAAPVLSAPVPGTTPASSPPPGISTAMLFVRNPTGVSHSPAEHAETRRLPGRRRGADRRARASWPVSGRDDRRWRRARAGCPSGCRARRPARGRPTGGSPPSTPAQPAPATPSGCPAWCCPGWPTPTATPSTARCAAAPTRGGGTFWTWRERMYAVAARLDPDTTSRWPAPSTPRWRWPAITCVGEFHYLHHGPAARRTPTRTRWARRWSGGRARPASGSPCSTPATSPAGSTGDGHTPLDARAAAVLRRHASSAGPSAWRALRADAGDAGRRGDPLGARGAARELGAWSARAEGTPLHVHLSEQPAENDACPRRSTAARRPRCCRRTALLGPRTTAVHATHLTADDIALLGAHRHHVLLLPDHRARPRRRHRPGPRPARRRVPAVASARDQHAVIDLFEEARGLEMHERLVVAAARPVPPRRAARARPRAAREPRLARRRPASRPVRAPTRGGPAGPPRTAGSDPAQIAADRHRGRRPHGRGRRPGGRHRGPAPSRRRRRAARRTPSAALWEDAMTTTAGHRHRRAGHVRRHARRPDRSSACCTTPRSWSTAAGCVDGPAARAPAADRGSTWGAEPSCRGSWTPTPTWCSPGTGRRSSPPG